MLKFCILVSALYNNTMEIQKEKNSKKVEWIEKDFKNKIRKLQNKTIYIPNKKELYF